MEKDLDIKEIQKDLSDYLAKKYGQRVQFAGFGAIPEPEGEKVGEGEKEKKGGTLSIQFDMKPEELKSYLDEYLVKQDEAKEVLATKVCTHFNRIKAFELQNKNKRHENVGEIKNNIIMIGPTGVGKTFLVKLIAKKIGVPFVKGDATKFSETGYVGGDVEDLVRDLVYEANGNIDLAQYGIIYLDEVDKIAASPNLIGPDVSRSGVQRALLKPMEETEVELKVPHDPVSQMEAVMEFQKTGKRERKKINTKYILFIMSGAFSGLEEIIKKRLNRQEIGFGAEIKSKDERAEYLRLVKAEDLIQYGFESEFIGRLPVVTVFEHLEVEDLYNILTHSEGSVIRQYESSFHAFGIDVIFSDPGLRAIAEKAALENTGARGLLTVCERTLREFKFELPSSKIRQFVVTRELVENPPGELQRILNEPTYEQRQVMRQCVREFERKFAEKHNLTIRLADDATEEIITRALAAHKSVGELCRELFKDYQFGLNLVKGNSGQSEFVIPVSALADPDKFLSDWVVSSYRPG